MAKPKAGAGGAKPGSGSAAPAPAPGDDGGEIEMGDDAGSGSGSGSASGEGEIDMGAEDTPKEGDLNADLAADGGDGTDKPVKGDAPAPKLGDYQLSWRDIVTVIRKPFLKLKRTELRAMAGTTMNDNIVRHYAFGGELSYYLTDVLAIGLEGQYYQHQFREPFDLVARQARRLPTVNQYNFSGALNFHYVPVYGKFAVLDKKIVTWEVAFTAGIGALQSEVVPRDKRFGAFKSILISPNVGADMRFFLFKSLTINAGIRDYIFVDKFEPVNRSESMYPTADEAKAHADTSLINNVMFQLSVSLWLPTTFEYHTFR
ncbi:MAG: outer membrane beta-barrel domain-containing protein [Deltaproteobacteria bacterium]|nr:outer membrane beta-barrel domain-containing protein [Deltaproteobacteria bacterium]